MPLRYNSFRECGKLGSCFLFVFFDSFVANWLLDLNPPLLGSGHGYLLFSPGLTDRPLVVSLFTVIDVIGAFLRSSFISFSMPLLLASPWLRSLLTVSGKVVMT